MVVEGQIHGGLTEGFAIAFMQEIQYDEQGNNLNTNFTDYLVPTVARDAALGDGQDGHAEPASSDRREGRGREPERRLAGRVRQRGHRRAFAAGVRHIDMPMTREKVWRAIRDAEAKHVNLE